MTDKCALKMLAFLSTGNIWRVIQLLLADCWQTIDYYRTCWLSSLNSLHELHEFPFIVQTLSFCWAVKIFTPILVAIKIAVMVFHCCPCCCCCCSGCCGAFQQKSMLQLISFVVSCSARNEMRRNETEWDETKWNHMKWNEWNAEISQQFVLSAALLWHSCLLSFLVFQGMRPSIQVNAESSAAQEGRLGVGVGVSRRRGRPSKPRRSENKSCPGLYLLRLQFQLHYPFIILLALTFPF